MIKHFFVSLAAMLLVFNPCIAAPKGEPVFCNPLNKVLSEAKKSNGFDRLVDGKKQTLTSEDGALEFYPSTLKIGSCLIDTSVKKPTLVCVIPFTSQDPKSFDFYKTFVTQVELCLGPKITASKIDKAPVKKFLPELQALANFNIGENLRLEVNLDRAKGSNNLCTDMPYAGCKEQAGVYFKAILNPK